MKKINSDKRQLNICPLEIYDATLSEPRIGVKSCYSDTLLKNLLASVIADRTGSKSVDYVKKRYLNDWKRGVALDPDAFDLKTIRFLDGCIYELQKHLVANSHNLVCSDIQSIADVTLLAGLGTLRVALDLSSKGLLREMLALCRLSLEMMSWSFAIFDLPHEGDPFEFLPEKAISGFKSYFPYAGQYYGYLSRFSHWRKETHTRAFEFDEKTVAVLYASGEDKWEAIANVMLMARLYAQAYTAKYSSLKCKPGGSHHLSEICAVSEKIRKKQKEWLKFFMELHEQNLTKSFVDIFLASAGAT